MIAEQTQGEHSLHPVPIYNKIRDYLLESDYYVTYRDHFISKKLYAWHKHYRMLPISLKPRLVSMIRESLIADDREFCCSASKKQVPKIVRLFYEKIDGGFKESLKYQVFSVISPIIKLPERFLRRRIVKPFKAWFAHRTNVNQNTNDIGIISLPFQESEEFPKRHVA